MQIEVSVKNPMRVPPGCHIGSGVVTRRPALAVM
jgi:hypothetical protein